MKKHIKTKLDHFSMSLLISYLSVLAIPLMAVVLIYFTASNLLLNVQKEKLYTMLHTTATDVRRSVEEACNLGSYISTSKELEQLCEKMQIRSQYYDMYEYVQESTNYSMFNTAIESVYVFFENGDYIIKDAVVVPSEERGYRSVGALGEETYKDLQERLQNRYYNKEILDFAAQNGKIAIAQSFPYQAFDHVRGTLVVVINDKMIEKQLRTNLIRGEGITLMVDTDSLNQPVLQKTIVGEKSRLAINDISIEEVLNSKSDTITIKGEKYIVCMVEDKLFPYTYISILPKQIILSQIGGIKYIIVALCVCSIIMGLGVCIIFWQRRRRVVLVLSEYHDEFGRAEGNGKRLHSFWESIPNLLDNVVNLQNTLALQRNFVHTAVIRKLLYGEYRNVIELEEDMQSADIVLEGNSYYVAAMTLKGDVLNEDIDIWNEVRLIVKQYMEEIPIPNHYCELDPYHGAMIFPVCKRESLAIIKEKLTEFSEVLLEDKRLEVYIGIGREVSERIEIATSFDDSQEVSTYLSFHKIRTVMDKEEMPKQNDHFFFPIETELHLVRIIKQGNSEELEDIFRVILFENFTYRKLTVTMLGHLYDLVRATVMRALKEGNGCEDVIQQIQKAEGIEEIRNILRETLQVFSPCKKKKEEEEHEAKAKIKVFIQDQFCDPNFTLAQLADQMQVTESRLYKQFKQLFGISFSEYLEQERIKKACELLKQKVPVKEVAETVGYGSDFSFRRAFKRVMGLAPSYYAEGLEE